jgi:hypothetical protein
MMRGKVSFSKERSSECLRGGAGQYTGVPYCDQEG